MDKMVSKITPPASEAELLQRAQALAGLTLLDAAAQGNFSVPARLHHDKGWVGQLLETLLGATAGTLSEPDFQQIGVELKTIPVNANGMPRESTYVCVVPLLNMAYQQWHTSNVRIKLARVLWMPIEGQPSLPIRERRLGSPLLWSPEPEIESQLQADWEEFAELISLGQVESISAHQGVYLQIRPKAAHSRAVCEAIGYEGKKILTLPRGFYLRTRLTKQILSRYYLHLP